jgi:hypothetical protein
MDPQRTQQDQQKPLPSCSDSELNALWQRAFKAPIPGKLKRVHRIACLTYRQQELQEGGLTKGAQRHLAELIDGRTTVGARRRTHAPRVKAGTRLLRSWQGRTYLVTITEDGYLYEGRPYTNLSVIAREITGARWSGPKFFGLKQLLPAKEAR